MKSMTQKFLLRSPKNPRPLKPNLPRDVNMPRLALFLSALILSTVSLASAQTKPDKDYLVYVLSESADTIALVRFGPNGARVDHDFKTGAMPSDLNGPHGIAISSDKQFYYVSLAHGR